MESYIVSARKYRPDTFESVVAQKSLTTTLKNAIQSGKLAHAYLFCGPRGVGKTTCARIFAKTINCMNPTSDGEPCNQCESCKSFNQQRSYSIYELDAASNNSVEDIRSLNEQVRIPPQVGKYKVYIIDEVHMLSQAAFNAFLKTLEEPPAHAIFILATTEKHKIIPTILSRCQIYDFSRIETADIIGHLQGIATKENINTEREALRIIAQKSDGCMRDALSLFDQMVSFTQGDLTYAKVIESLNVLDYDYYFRLTDLVLDGKIHQSLLLFNEVLNKGFEGNIFIEGTASHFRDLLVNSDEATAPLFEGSDELRKRYIEQAKRCKPKMLFNAIKLCNNCCMNYRTSRNKRLLVELTLIELSQLGEGDNDDSGGHRPKMLKPIFNKQQSIQPQPSERENPSAGQVAQSRATVRQDTTAGYSPAISQTVQTTVVQKATNTMPASQTKDVATQATGIQRQVIHGRPEELQTRNGGRTIGGMFSRSRERNTLTDSPTPTGTVAEQAVPHPQIPEHKTISEGDVIQAWTSYALQLPEKEKALADRMKIMKPTLTSEGIITINVDNKLAAALFENEAKRITEGMSTYLNGTILKLKTHINEIVVERHVSDKGEQFKVLKEKNPLIEKLRKELNLEIAR